MIILGIDPGYAIVGWGVIEYSGSKFRTLGYGSITTPAGMPTVDRLERIYRGMQELIEKYKPDQMAVEELFFNTNGKTAIDSCKGVVCPFLALPVAQQRHRIGRIAQRSGAQIVKISLPK